MSVLRLPRPAWLQCRLKSQKATDRDPSRRPKPTRPLSSCGPFVGADIALVLRPRLAALILGRAEVVVAPAVGEAVLGDLDGLCGAAVEREAADVGSRLALDHRPALEVAEPRGALRRDDSDELERTGALRAGARGTHAVLLHERPLQVEGCAGRLICAAAVAPSGAVGVGDVVGDGRVLGV